MEDFAVGPDAAVLALVRHQRKAQGRARMFEVRGKDWYLESHEALQIVRLKETGVMPLLPLQAPAELRASCGTILSVTWDPAISVGSRLGFVRDVVRGERVRIEPYKNFRCSSDRRTVAGWIDPEHTVLKIGVSPQQELVDPHGHKLLYDVSPNGRYLAFGGDGKLCVAEGMAASVCVSPQAHSDRLSVSDSGELLFVGVTEGGCYYKDQWHASTRPRPGYTEGDVCVAVAFWRPGEKTDQVLEPLGRDPQWITPEAASALLSWRSSRVSSSVH